MAKTSISKLKLFILRWLKRDAIAMMLFVLVTILMTYPLILHLGKDWVTEGRDLFMKLWDIWFLDRILALDEQPLFTRLIFYPNGLNLGLHNLSWTTSILSWLLIPLSGSILGAYKVTILIGLFASAYGAYFLILELAQDRTAAWFGGAIYAYAPFMISHSKGHPDVVFTVTIPIAALLLIKAIRHSNLFAAAGAGLAVALAAFTSMYILTFASLTLGFLYLFLMVNNRRWSTLEFWKVTAVFGAVSLLLLGVRFIPWFLHSENITSAIDSEYSPSSLQADLLATITPSVSHTVFGPIVDDVAENFKKSRGQPPYLGIVPIALTISALTWKGRRKDVWPWFGIGVFFLLLSLGSVLRINGEKYEQVPMLLPYLDWIPPIRGVRTNFFHVGLLLPLAVCSAFGLARWLKALEDKRILQNVLVACLAVLLLFEYWNGPYPMMHQLINPFYYEMATMPEDIAIVELPISDQLSKDWIYFQTVHGHPMVGGRSGRTPDHAYEYIEQNFLLSSWRAKQDLKCEEISANVVGEALDELVGHNIRYVIIHRSLRHDFLFPYFPIEPAYQDVEIIVFDLLTLQETPPCSSRNAFSSQSSS